MIRINLIRDTAVVAPARSRAVPLLLGVVGAAVLAAVELTLASQLTALSVARDTLRLEIAKEESAIARRRSAGAARVTTAGQLGSTSAGRRLRHVATAVPQGLWLTAYSERRGEVTMHGVAANDEAARAFVDNLLAASAFTAAEITETSRANADGDGGLTGGALTFRLQAACAENEKSAEGGSPQ